MELSEILPAVRHWLERTELPAQVRTAAKLDRTMGI